MKVKDKLVLITSIAFIILCVGSFYSPVLLRGFTHEKTGIIYRDYKPLYANIALMVCDTADNIFVVSNSSDCLMVYSPEGKVLFSIFFPLMESSSVGLISFRDGSVLVASFGSPRYRIWSNGEIAFEPTPDDRKETLAMDYNQDEIYMNGSKSIINSQGDRFVYNWLTLRIRSIPPTGKGVVFVSNSLGGWLLGSPFPAALWAIVGGSLFINYKRKSEYKHY